MPHKRSDFINYKVRLCSDADLQAVDGLLRRSLYLGEPLARGLDPADIPGREEGHASALIPQGMSLMAETLGEVPRVIGACLNDRPPQSDTYIYTKTIEDKKFQDLFNYMEERSGVVDLAPDAVEMRLIAVEEDWRQRGVAKSLVGATEEICRFQGYPWIKTYCTSSYTARLLEKLNWRPVFSLNYLDYITDNGCDIKPPPCPHTHATVYIKALTEDKT